MPLNFYLNGRLVASGEIEEGAADAPAQAADGRSLLDNTSAVYHVDGSVVKITGRQFNAAIKLPDSGNYTRVMPVKTTEAIDHSQDSDIKALIAGRVYLGNAQAAQDAQNAAMQAQMTNLKVTGSVPGTNNFSAVVKTKTNS